jgi:phosphate transport system substrate-binding protein
VQPLGGGSGIGFEVAGAHARSAIQDAKTEEWETVTLKKFLVLGLIAAMLTGVFALAGCSSEEPATDEPTTEAPATELEGSIVVQGSDTMLNISTAWSEAFMDANPGVDISVQGGGSGTGIAALLNGTVDFANASREIKDEEAAAAETAP